MSYEEDKSKQIAISVAIKGAIDLTVALIRSNPEVAWTEDAAVNIFEEVVDKVIAKSLAVHGASEVSQAFQGAFVGATVAPATVQAPVQAPFVPTVVQSVAPVAPTPIPGVVDGDPATSALWTDLFTDQSGWFDNRTSKMNSAAPDFRSKKFKDATGRPVGLWRVGKGNPSWVAAQLAARGLA